MGEARKVMDQLTEALNRQDFDAVAKMYSPDALGISPLGEFKGGDQIAEFFRGYYTAFPDAEIRTQYRHESGNTAVDESMFVGTNTGPLKAPNGDEMPATGKSISLWGCDIAEVEDGKITSHRFYYDTMSMLAQLGMAPPS